MRLRCHKQRLRCQRSHSLPTNQIESSAAVNVSVFLRKGGGAMFDMALCLSFPYWPAVANDWIARHRPGGWLSRELVSSGCALVPATPLRSLTG